MIAETEASKVEAEIAEFVRKMRVPIGDLSRLFGRKDGADLSAECAVLIWFLDAQIAFNQLDNELFREFVRTLKGSIASRSTVVASLLPVLHTYVVTEMRSILQQCSSFWVTSDGFSRHFERYVSQHYHLITPSTFEYHILCLDVIPFCGPKFAELLAGTLAERQRHWTGDLQPEPLLAGIVTDGESKFKAAGELLVGDDWQRCQNHLLKSVYELGESTSGQYLKDFTCMSTLAAHICSKGGVQRDMRVYQIVNDLSEYVMVTYNDTRWEGRYRLVSRFRDLQATLCGVFEGDPFLDQLRESVDDFLKASFFARCAAYVTVLERLNSVSLFYQHQSFPTGCFVPLLVQFMLCATISTQMDPQFVIDFKTAFHNALKEKMGWILTTPNNFLKAALMHPGVAKTLRGFVSKQVVEECTDSILSDACSLESADNDEFRKLAFKKYLEQLGDVIQFPSIEVFPWHALSARGESNGIDHLSFWRAAGQNRGPLSFLVGVAAMLLAMPAGESVDEVTFSSTGATMTKERNRLSLMNVEQITVIRMFLRRYKWNPSKLDVFVKHARASQSE